MRWYIASMVFGLIALLGIAFNIAPGAL
jgi:hypothetical protein